MQSDWSSRRNDGHDRDGAAPEVPIEGERAAGHEAGNAFPENSLDDDAVPENVATSGAVGAGEDAGEEDAHRSAVDAVDGLLDEVELALARLDDGTYGRCETCGSVIDDTDLAARPLVRECRGCGAGVLVEGA